VLDVQHVGNQFDRHVQTEALASYKEGKYAPGCAHGKLLFLVGTLVVSRPDKVERIERETLWTEYVALFPNGPTTTSRDNKSRPF
jgi:hypothetical protein